MAGNMACLRMRRRFSPAIAASKPKNITGTMSPPARGFAFGFSKIFTTRYRAPGLRYGADVSPEGGYLHLSYNF